MMGEELHGSERKGVLLETWVARRLGKGENMD
jgi:hypothetical protein